MTKKTRLTILLSCMVCFLIVAPAIILYSMGYRVDFEKMEIVATGGIYVRTFPAADQITIDSKIKRTPGLFANSVFEQSLLPKNHTILITKDGYYDYSKTLPVLEKEVTKLENVLLFKKDIKFEAVTDKTLSPFLPAQEEKNTIKLPPEALKTLKGNVYKMISDGQNILVNNNGSLLLLNKQTNNLDELAGSVKDARISPDGKNIVYFTSREISVLPSDQINKKTTLYKSEENIIDCIWLNNDYIIFNTRGKITISEIDYRSNINAVVLPQAADKIFFSSQDNKLYILIQNTLLASGKLTP